MHLLRDVIACYTHYHSESEPSVGTPPPSTLQHHQPRAAACSERRDAGLAVRRETERGEDALRAAEDAQISIACQDKQQY